MTNNQLTYQKNLETERSNRAQEELGRNQLAETVRSNMARETETSLHNRITERETERANRANEEHQKNSLAESIRHNQVTETETARHNQVTEQQTYVQLAESERHNRASENLSQQSVNASIYGAQLSAAASRYATDTNAANMAAQIQANKEINEAKIQSAERINTDNAAVKVLDISTRSSDNAAQRKNQLQIAQAQAKAGVATTGFNAIKDVAVSLIKKGW